MMLGFERPFTVVDEAALRLGHSTTMPPEQCLTLAQHEAGWCHNSMTCPHPECSAIVKGTPLPDAERMAAYHAWYRHLMGLPYPWLVTS